MDIFFSAAARVSIDVASQDDRAHWRLQVLNPINSERYGVAVGVALVCNPCLGAVAGP